MSGASRPTPSLAAKALAGIVAPPRPAPGTAAAGRPAAPRPATPTRPVRTAASRAELERRIAEDVGRFDIIALLDLLAELGYRQDDIFFESNISTASQARLLHAIEFRKEPIEQVIVTVNLGLLGPQGPIPSYFHSALETGAVDEEQFTTFLRFFDHVLIQRFILSAYPERDPSIFKDWEETKRCYLDIVGLTSLTTLHWLFQGVFPELGVDVNHGVARRELMTEGVRLGTTKIGDGTALGGKSAVPVRSVEVRLICEEDETSTGRPWAEEARQRLTTGIFPILEHTTLELWITLVIRSQRGFAQLRQGSYLGFDRIRGGAERHRVVLVHKGQVPRR